MSDLPQAAGPAKSRNRYDRNELAGAFGDLGTLIPFVVAYITLLHMDPFGVLFAFGAAKIAAGLVYRVPFPIQPMKAAGAIATTQAVQTLTVTPNMVFGAGLATGLIWLVLGVTGLTRRVADLIGRPVAQGIILGLGFSFMLDGIHRIATDWLIGGAALAGTLLLLGNRRIPVMLLLLAFGAAAALFRNPALLGLLEQVRPVLHVPKFALGTMTWSDFLLGATFLALPQLPLTLGNAIIGITEENNALFPDRPVTERKVAMSTGIMNLLAPLFGGVPMCHGAGGMAGHVAFSARTGGALVILGSIIMALALFFSDSISIIFRVFPDPVLGVILFITGSQLALGTCAIKSFGKKENFAMLVTAAFSMWNVGIAVLAGALVHRLIQRGSIQI